jgi:DNA-binding GntR family transcriptional regulator
MSAKQSKKAAQAAAEQAAANAKPALQPPKADSRQSATLTKSVYEQLRAEVLNGSLRPGEKLGAEALRTRLNTGSSPVREALNRLLSEGLVALEEQKGFRVASVSKEELSELVRARGWIDGAAMAESISRFDAAWEENLVLALHRLTKTSRRLPDNSRNLEWENAHKSFHNALIGGCDSRWMFRISEQLFDAAERYRLLAADHVPERNELDEHKAIVDACFARNTAKAIDLLKQHYGQTFSVIVKSLHEPKETNSRKRKFHGA